MTIVRRGRPHRFRWNTEEQTDVDPEPGEHRRRLARLTARHAAAEWLIE